MMFVCCLTVVLFIRGVFGGYINIGRSFSVNRLSDRQDTVKNETGKLFLDAVNRESTKNKRSVDSLPEDALVSLLTGLILKAVVLLPSLLAGIGLVIGLHKIALLLGGGLVLYQYIKDNSVLLPNSNPPSPPGYKPEFYDPPGSLEATRFFYPWST